MSSLFHLVAHAASSRSEKDQEVLLSTQDKVLVGLRALSSSLTPDLHRHFQTALLALVAQSGFTKKVTSVARPPAVMATQKEFNEVDECWV